MEEQAGINQNSEPVENKLDAPNKAIIDNYDPPVSAIAGVAASITGAVKSMSKMLSSEQQDALDDLVDHRTKLFISLFDKMEAENIPLDGPEAKAIAKNATSDVGISQKVENLADLKLETLTEYEVNQIVTKARSAIKRTLELRQKFAPILKKETQPDGSTKRVPSGSVYGPYQTNRKQRLGLRRQLVKSSYRRASQRPATASSLVVRIKEKAMLPV
jgi:hypothetical protein